MSDPQKISFSIPIAEGFKTLDAGKNTIRIRGVALKGDIISKNNRMYVAKELAKACNTWIGKPVNINHNNNMNVGHITFMDYENDLLTYEAEITKQPYVNLLRNKSAEIKGVSIQADYLFNRCIKCGEKFYDENTFHTHMNREHFIKTDPASTPHGIIGNGLAIVLSPEIPGYSGTSVELAEVWRVKSLQLLETVIKEEKEKEKMNEQLSGKAVLTPNTPYTINRAVEKKEEKTKVESEEKPPNQQSTQKPLVKTETPPPTDPPKAAEKLTLTEIQKPALKEIVLTEKTETDQVTLKPEGKLTPLTETKTKLSLGEPFAGYDNFEACVAANSDKENPEAYCGEVKHKAEEYMVAKKQVAELTAKVNELIASVNQPIVTSKVNESWRIQTGQLKEALTQLQGEVTKLPEQFNNALKTITEAVNNLPQDDLGWKEIKIPEPYNDAALKEAIAAIKPYDDAPIKDAIAKVPVYDDKELRGLVTALQKENGELKENVIHQKQDFEARVASNEKALKETTETNSKALLERDEKIKKLQETLDDFQKKKLEETEKLTARVDNLEDKLKPEFKGKNTQLNETKDKPYVNTPDKGAN